VLRKTYRRKIQVTRIQILSKISNISVTRIKLSHKHIFCHKTKFLSQEKILPEENFWSQKGSFSEKKWIPCEKNEFPNWKALFLPKE
jgi:hypothetical protein